MKRIDILVSASEEVQKERIVAEQSIRCVSAELGLPVTVSYSDWLRRPKPENETSPPESENRQDGLLLCPHFQEHQDSKPDAERCEQILNPGQYDLVINVLRSQLGTRSPPMFVMPDGSQPGSATEYEIAWALDQSKLTPGFPELRVYRNRATPAAPLEPKEKREDLSPHWDAVQEFCAAWEKNGDTGFRECCHEYRDLEEFENLFREHFRDFLARQLDRQIGLRKALRKVRYLEANPFRGLNFFDFEHAALYYGRTKAVWEVLDALKNQVEAKKAFVLVLGPTGSGKSSLVRAGVLPLLTQGGTPLGNGPWRRAVTRPGTGGVGGDPFDTLAAALLGKFALPELQDEESTVEGMNLASRLRKDPDAAAGRLAVALDQLTWQELDRLETGGPLARRSEGVGVVRPENLGPIKPRMRLALVVDQLEELFAGGISPVLQRKYISALGALAKCERVFIIATLRSGFYADCQQFPEFVELTALSGTYELQAPTPRGIGNIIRFPAEAVGLRFERDPDTGRSLDEALQEAAIASAEPLPLLEHLLSQLYRRQLERKDGLLLWSDYRELGELQDALAQHEKTVFSTLKSDEQRALKFVIRHLAAPGRGEEGHLIRRTVAYRDLILSPELNEGQRAGAMGLLDRLIKEGLLSADADPEQGLLISVPQEAMLRRWPGVWHWLSEDQHFFQMRDRLDASLKLWLSRGRHSGDLLDRGIGLAEAETLRRDFGSSLNEGQIDYIRKSLAKQKRRRWMRDGIGLAAIAGLALFAAFASIGRFSTESKRKNGKQGIQLAQQNTDLATSQRSALETELKKAREEKAQLAQQNVNLAGQSSALETELKKAEEKAQIAQQNTDLATSQRNALETELKKAQEEKAQLAQQNANLTRQSSNLETQLNEAEEKAQIAQQNVDLATSQRSALETELQKAQEEKAQLELQNTNLTNQSSALETELEKAEEKAQIAQQNTDLATSQRNALETELKKAQEERARLELQNANLQKKADLTSNKPNTSKTQVKKAKGKRQLTQQQTRKRKAQQTQRKKAPGKASRTKKRSTDTKTP
jgi:hypothetical protein